MNKKHTFKIGDQEVTASYDAWEELFDRLEELLGLPAVEFNKEDEEEIITEMMPMLMGLDENSMN